MGLPRGFLNFGPGPEIWGTPWGAGGGWNMGNFFFKIFDFFDGFLLFGVCYLFKILFLTLNTITSSLKKILKWRWLFSTVSKKCVSLFSLAWSSAYTHRQFFKFSSLLFYNFYCRIRFLIKITSLQAGTQPKMPTSFKKEGKFNLFGI